MFQGLMPHREHDYPVSRDWEDIDCSCITCIYNRYDKCSVASLAKIGDDGRCKGFKLKKAPKCDI